MAGLDLKLDIDIKNPEETKALSDDLLAIIPRIRVRRLQQIEVWLRNHAAWRGTYTRSFYHSDTFNHYVPMFRRTVERFVRRGAQMLLPGEEFFEVAPLDDQNDFAGKEAEATLNYMRYITSKKIKINPLTKRLLRSFALYGRAITKTSVRTSSEGGKEVIWPHWRDVDPFMFLVWPETEGDLDNCRIIAEDMIIPYERYVEMAQAADAQPIDQKELSGVTWPHYITRRLQQSGIGSPPSEAPSPSTTTQTGEQRASGTIHYDWVYLSEVWVNSGTYWKYCWVVWNKSDGIPQVTKISDTKFNRSLYRMSIDRDVAGEQYTSSMGDDLEPVQIFFNDSINMFMEGQAMGMSGPVAVDPNQIGRAGSLIWRPRAKWFVPPDSVKPVMQGVGESIAKNAVQGINYASNLFEQFGGSSPMAEGQGVRNMPRAGFAVSSLMSMSMADTRDACKSIEEDLLTPGLHDIWYLTRTYVPDTQIFPIPGTRDSTARKVPVGELDGDWDFNWIGALQAAANQDKAQRYMQFMQSLAPMMQYLLQDLQARGLRINWTLLFKRAWRYGLGEFGADSIIEQMPQQQQPPPGGPSGGAPGGPGAPGGQPDPSQAIEHLQNMGLLTPTDYNNVGAE